MTEPARTTADETQPRLHRRLGILNATSINMSNMIGIGPFITAAPILATMGGPQALVGWLVGTLLALADGLVASELGASLPNSGGSYVFLRDSFGPERWGKLMAWLFVWQFLFSGTLEIASGTVGMVQYLTYLWQGLGENPWGMRFMAAGIASLVVFSLYRKIGDVAKLMLVLWITALVTTGWVILTGLLKMNTKLAFDLPEGAFQINPAFWVGLGNSTVLAIYNFLGYNQVCCLAGEVRRPERTIPYAVILSVLGVAVIDSLLCLGFIGVIPWWEVIEPGTLANRAVASVFMSRSYGEWAAVLISVMILFTAFASVFALMLGYSRIPYAAALDGAFFRWFGVLHPKAEFPHRSLLLVGALSIGASFFGLIEIITAMILARVLAQFAAQIVGLLVLRKMRPEVPRPFRMWLYPLPALFALAGWLFVFFSPAFQPGGWKYMLYALGTLVTGLALYFVLARKKRDWPYAA